MSMFEKVCRMTQPRLKEYVAERLAEAGYEVVVDDGFVYAKGTLDVLLTAHLDTVHKEPVRKIKRKDGVFSSPQGIGGDDRCGVWIILTMLKETELRPTILFCEDEEIGGRGSDKFCDSEYAVDMTYMKFMVELDRANANDAVYYNCDNPDFTDFITELTGYKEAWGTFSDISNLCPVGGVAGVNLSCGYYKAHTTNEYVVLRETERTKNVVVKLLKHVKANDVPQYLYIESKWSGWGRDDEYYYYNYYGAFSQKTWEQTVYGELYVCYMDAVGGETETTIFADTQDKALAEFFITHPDVCYNDILVHEFY